jgi:hypothetical protein
MEDVGAGVGSFTEKGLYPLATLPVMFGVADMTTGVMKGVSKKVAGKTKKTKKKTKSTKKKKKK